MMKPGMKYRISGPNWGDATLLDVASAHIRKKTGNFIEAI